MRMNLLECGVCVLWGSDRGQSLYVNGGVCVMEE